MTIDAILIAGPTASGKSAAATALAQALNGIVVNTDSMQVYAEAQILTARPSDDDEAKAPHALYGHVSVHEPYSVGRYRADAETALATARARRVVPIFTGGTGLYFEALTAGLAEIPSVPAAVREATRALRERIGAEEFHAQLVRRDAEAAARLNAGDTQRTLRAFEVFEATGKPLGYWQTQKGAPLLTGHIIRIVVSPPREVLHARINARFDAMMIEGAQAEAQMLAQIAPALPAAKILGRRELLAAAAGEISLDEATARAKAATRQYAKRQLTWFRNRFGGWQWVEASAPDNILAAINAAVT